VILFCGKTIFRSMSLGDITTAVAPIGLCSRPAGQFHQQRGCGAAATLKSPGHCIPQWRHPAAPPQPALRGGSSKESALFAIRAVMIASAPEAPPPPPALSSAAHRDLRFCAYHREFLTEPTRSSACVGRA